MSHVSEQESCCAQGVFPGSITDPFKCAVTETVGEDCMCGGEGQMLEVKMMGTNELLDGRCR